MKFDALIFDLDGTLWDSTETVCDVWNGAFSDMGLDFRVTAEDIRREMGKLLSVIMDDLAPGLSPEKQDELYRRVCEAENIKQHLEEEKIYVRITVPNLSWLASRPRRHDLHVLDKLYPL